MEHTSWVKTRGRGFVLDGQTIILRGVNWFGFETDALVAHGLWIRTLESILDQIRDLPANLLRLPFCNDALRQNTFPNDGAINFELNPTLVGLTSIEVLDLVVAGCAARGIRILLDRHRPTRDKQSELWYTDGDDLGCSEAVWISDWTLLARRYVDEPMVIGADLHNEPHGCSTWGDGNVKTDWRLAAERCGNAILAVNPNWLIVVEGIQSVLSCPEMGIGASEEATFMQTWWGSNFMGALEHPVRLNMPENLVYSPHDYPASVYRQPWFDDPEYPKNLPMIWDRYWGHLCDPQCLSTVPILVGEFGTFVESEEDQKWLKEITLFLSSRQLSFTFWCFNPNSADTGGILLDDWATIHPQKHAILKPLLDEASVTTRGIST